MGNAEGVWFCGTDSKRLQASDVRNSVNMKGKASGPRLHQLVAGRIVFFTNWMKIQHIPTFGLHNVLQWPTCDASSLEMYKLMDYGMICKIAPNVTRVVLFLAKEDERKLRAACEALGLGGNMMVNPV